MEKTKHRHLTLDERITIQAELSKSTTFKEIAQTLGKDPTTISKEIRKRRVTRSVDYVSTKKIEPCELLEKAPYVCNGCSKRRSCKLEKQMYDHKEAHKQYTKILVESRESIALNNPTFWEIDKIVSEGIKKGQHLYHILKSHKIPVSEATVYRWLHKGHLTVSKFKFPRVVKFKPRKKKRADATPKVNREGRTYHDYLDFLKDNDFCTHIEMDTVIGTKTSSKVILTFTVVMSNFFFAYLLEENTAAEVVRVFDSIRADLDLFHTTFLTELFKVVLTDNGSEFSDALRIEKDENDKQWTNLFYCDPGRADQKPRAEKNHTMLRDILPKGTSFDELTQDELATICSHINGVKRKSFYGKSAYEMFELNFGLGTPRLLGIHYVKPEDVVQTPQLLEIIRNKD